MKKNQDDTHPIAEGRAENAIKFDTLNKTERDFLDILPERFRLAGFTAYKDYRKLNSFSSVFERSKMCTAFMNGFVTATHLVMLIDAQPKPLIGGEVTPEIPGN